MGIDLVLSRSVEDKRKIRIVKLKLTWCKTWYVFPKKESLLNQHPILESELAKSRNQLSFSSNATVQIKLTDEVKQHYLEGFDLVINGRKLVTLAESKKKEETFASQVRKLKFDPDNIRVFLNKFKNLMVDVEVDLVKTYLQGYLPIKDFEDRFKTTFTLSLNVIYEKLIEYYETQYVNPRKSCRDLKFEEADCVETFIEKKFELLSFNIGMPIQNKTKIILSQLPDVVKNECLNLPDNFMKDKSQFTNYIYFICSKNQQSLNKSISKSDLMRDNLNTSGNQHLNSTEITPDDNERNEIRNEQEEHMDLTEVVVESSFVYPQSVSLSDLEKLCESSSDSDL